MARRATSSSPTMSSLTRHARGARTVDAAGLTILPGLVDLHTHLREPGYEQSETVLTGSRAAAAGGFTAVFAMANTSPVADTAAVVEQVASLGEQHGYVTVRPIGAVTAGLEGERLSEIGAMARSRARVSVFSDDGKCVSDALLMRRALEYVKTFGGVIAQHAQEPRLTEAAQMNEGELSGELGLAGWPAVAEEAIIAQGRAARPARRRAASRLPRLHRGFRRHRAVGEGAWHRRDGRGDAAPPAADRGAREVIRLPLQGQSAAAPRRRCAGAARSTRRRHDRHRRDRPCASPARIEGVRVGRGILRHGRPRVGAQRRAGRRWSTPGCIGWSDVARVLSAKPAEIGRLAGYDSPFAVGAAANFTLYDPTASRVFGVDDLRGKSINSPYLGRRASRPGHRDHPQRLPDSPGRRTRRSRGGRSPRPNLPKEPQCLAPHPVAHARHRRRRDANAAAHLRAHRLRGDHHAGNRRVDCLAVAASAPFPQPCQCLRMSAWSGGEFEGFYVSTTLDGQPLNRVAVRGLGFRARATIAVADAGVVAGPAGQDRVHPARGHPGGDAVQLHDRPGGRAGRARAAGLDTRRNSGWTATCGSTETADARGRDRAAASPATAGKAGVVAIDPAVLVLEDGTRYSRQCVWRTRPHLRRSRLRDRA